MDTLRHVINQTGGYSDGLGGNSLYSPHNLNVSIIMAGEKCLADMKEASSGLEIESLHLSFRDVECTALPIGYV